MSTCRIGQPESSASGPNPSAWPRGTCWLRPTPRRLAPTPDNNERYGGLDRRVRAVEGDQAGDRGLLPAGREDGVPVPADHDDVADALRVLGRHGPVPARVDRLLAGTDPGAVTEHVPPRVEHVDPRTGRRVEVPGPGLPRDQ